MSGDFIFPLRTRKSELNAFFKAFPNFPKDTVHPKISEMNFETYWNFRKYQVNNLKISLMKRLNLALSKEITELPEEDLRKLGLSNLPKEELKELGLSSLNSIPDLKKLSPEQLNLDSFNLDSLDLDTLLGNVEDSDSARVKKIKDVLSKVGLADTAANRNEYYKRMLKLYDGISIDVQKPSKEYPNGRTVITKNGDELVIIKEDLSNNLNNMIFEIPSSLTKGNDPKTLEKLDQAITAMIDQTTRMRERSDDKRLEISGYENNPRVALRIYELAILQGSKPTLHKDTLAAWRAKAISENDPNGKFAKALKDYEKLVMSKPLSTFKKLKKLAAKKIQDRAKKPATETEPTTSAPATTAYLKKM